MCRFNDACVRQQLLRPELARLLDREEARPGLREAVKNASDLLECVEDILGRPDLPRQASSKAAAADFMAIVRGITDAAGEARERDVAALNRRIQAAVFGYLARMEAPADDL